MNNTLEEIGSIPVKELAASFGTPAYVYDLKIIEEKISDLKMFDVVRYAQKACSNLAILAVMRRHGVWVDAVSAGEIVRAVRAGYRTGPDSEEIIYTADMFDDDAVAFIKKYRVAVNVGSPDMITQLGAFAPGTRTTLRVNPGFGHGHSQKVNTGGALSKHGVWHSDIAACLELGEAAGVDIRGLHMHIGSGSDLEHLSRVCDAMVEAAKVMGSKLQVISAGGGLPIPYKPEDQVLDIKAYYDLWARAKKRIEATAGHPVSLEVEPGRYLIGQSGYLLTQIRSVKKSGGTWFYLVDAGFDTLIRPAMYGAYHRISICHRESYKRGETRKAVVAGPLCESCDVFTQEEGGFVTARELPVAEVGDYLVLHDVGAYGAVMSSNYNTRRMAPEILLTSAGPEVIKGRQSFDSMLAQEMIPESLRS